LLEKDVKKLKLEATKSTKTIEHLKEQKANLQAELKGLMGDDG